MSAFKVGAVVRLKSKRIEADFESEWRGLVTHSDYSITTTRLHSGKPLYHSAFYTKDLIEVGPLELLAEA